MTQPVQYSGQRYNDTKTCLQPVFERHIQDSEEIGIALLELCQRQVNVYLKEHFFFLHQNYVYDTGLFLREEKKFVAIYKLKNLFFRKNYFHQLDIEVIKSSIFFGNKKKLIPPGFRPASDSVSRTNIHADEVDAVKRLLILKKAFFNINLKSIEVTQKTLISAEAITTKTDKSPGTYTTIWKNISFKRDFSQKKFENAVGIHFTNKRAEDLVPSVHSYPRFTIQYVGHDYVNLVGKSDLFRHLNASFQIAFTTSSSNFAFNKKNVDREIDHVKTMLFKKFPEFATKKYKFSKTYKIFPREKTILVSLSPPATDAEKQNFLKTGFALAVDSDGRTLHITSKKFVFPMFYKLKERNNKQRLLQTKQLVQKILGSNLQYKIKKSDSWKTFSPQEYRLLEINYEKKKHTMQVHFNHTHTSLLYLRPKEKAPNAPLCKRNTKKKDFSYEVINDRYVRFSTHTAGSQTKQQCPEEVYFMEVYRSGSEPKVKEVLEVYSMVASGVVSYGEYSKKCKDMLRNMLETYRVEMKEEGGAYIFRETKTGERIYLSTFLGKKATAVSDFAGTIPLSVEDRKRIFSRYQLPNLINKNGNNTTTVSVFPSDGEVEPHDGKKQEKIRISYQMCPGNQKRMSFYKHTGQKHMRSFQPLSFRNELLPTLKKLEKKGWKFPAKITQMEYPVENKKYGVFQRRMMTEIEFSTNIEQPENVLLSRLVGKNVEENAVNPWYEEESDTSPYTSEDDIKEAVKSKKSLSTFLKIKEHMKRPMDKAREVFHIPHTRFRALVKDILFETSSRKMQIDKQALVFLQHTVEKFMLQNMEKSKWLAMHENKRTRVLGRDVALLRSLNDSSNPVPLPIQNRRNLLEKGRGTFKKGGFIYYYQLQERRLLAQIQKKVNVIGQPGSQTKLIWVSLKGGQFETHKKNLFEFLKHKKWNVASPYNSMNRHKRERHTTTNPLQTIFYFDRPLLRLEHEENKQIPPTVFTWILLENEYYQYRIVQLKPLEGEVQRRRLDVRKCKVVEQGEKIHISDYFVPTMEDVKSVLKYLKETHVLGSREEYYTSTLNVQKTKRKTYEENNENIYETVKNIFTAKLEVITFVYLDYNHKFQYRVSYGMNQDKSAIEYIFQDKEHPNTVKLLPSIAGKEIQNNAKRILNLEFSDQGISNTTTSNKNQLIFTKENNY